MPHGTASGKEMKAPGRVPPMDFCCEDKPLAQLQLEKNKGGGRASNESHNYLGSSGSPTLADVYRCAPGRQNGLSGRALR